MKYTVVWTRRAEGSLTTIWLDARDRLAITRAAEDIDRALQIDPLGVGESRDSDKRILFAPPLAVIYSIHPDDMVVKVLRVWTMRTRKQS